MSFVDNSKHLSLIDAGISNLWSLSFPGHLESLNLHGNCIQHIGNLSHLTHLVHLDLSANQITVVDGLQRLVALKTLNLSCNLLTSVDGLSDLKSLERLNLSYNQLDDVQGLASLSRSTKCKLKYIALHGNKLREVRDLVSALKGCTSLHQVVLSQDGSTNPLCHGQGYELELRKGLPQLEFVNDTNVSGRMAVELDSVAAIPGLEAYLDFLLSNDKEDQDCQESKDTGSSPRVLITPKIDAVMEQFKQRYSGVTESSSSTAYSHHLSNLSSPLSENAQRTESMRQILTSPHLQSASRGHRSKAAGHNLRQVEYDSVAEREYQVTKSSTDSEKVSNLVQEGIRKKANATSKSGAKKDKTTRPEWNTSKNVVPRRQQSTRKNAATRETQEEARGTSDLDAGARANYARDKHGRQEAETVYKDLLSTLEQERERRWKAEQATRRLADILKEIQAKGQETESMKNSALEATVQLKQAVMNEHESNQVLKGEIKGLQHEIQQLRGELTDARRAELKSRDALKVVEESMARKEGDDLTERVHQGKKLQEVQQRATAMTREAEMLRHSLEVTKAKVTQLQETLASREQQHREDMSNRYSLESPELQKVINEQVKKVEQAQHTELIRQQQRVETLTKQYTDLENEFRHALRIEEDRFTEMKAVLEDAQLETREHQQLLMAAQRKDETSTTIIGELTSLVKEQKGRISELARSKQEQTLAQKDRVQTMEEQLEEARRQLTHLELSKQAKSKLQATVQAQESVIEGLKAERKLWGQELAQQGATLAQDRGRLEAKIETFYSEMAMLKKQLERETDSVKIKTKMVEDQTETIRKLKEALVERDETIRSTREESLTVQRSMEEQLGELKAALDDSRDVIDRTSARKEELKQQVLQLQEEVQEAKDYHSNVSAKWKEKSVLIGKLEQQVTQMKNSWSQKEVTLTAERDLALKQAKQAVDKLKAVDSAFRQQLEIKETSFQEQINRIQAEKQQEMELANQKVAMVEDEMRDLLQENEASKRAMENKVKKLNQALGDLQSDLL